MDHIDTHQHFWSYDPVEYPWMKPDWPIRKSFLPADLKPLLQQSGFDRCVAVQARQTVAETRWLLDLARHNEFIVGVVGWVDLRSPTVEEQLQSFAENPKFVGVRHVVQDEPDDNFLIGEDFVRGIRQLHSFGLAYDLLVFPKQLPAAIQLTRDIPQQPFVLDHLAKPLIRDQQIEPWRKHIRELAKAPNVYCKISGMVTEANWANWKQADFRPYLDVVWEAFGEDRLMVGSDWPVCLLSAEYSRVMQVALDFLKQFSETVREKVLGKNASRFYRLPV